MAQDKGLSSLDKVMIAARAADSKKATDILIQDVRELVGITDFFVIVTAQNNRQIYGCARRHRRGRNQRSGREAFQRRRRSAKDFRALQDYGEFVVHVFPARRARLLSSRGESWNDAPTIPFVSENETASEEE